MGEGSVILGWGEEGTQERPLAIALFPGKHPRQERARVLYRREDFLGLHMQELIWLRVPSDEQRNQARHHLSIQPGGEYFADPYNRKNFGDYISRALPSLSGDDLRRIITEATCLLLNPA